MQLYSLAVLLLASTSAITAFSIPDGQPRGLYVASIDSRSGKEVYKKLYNSVHSAKFWRTSTSSSSSSSSLVAPLPQADPPTEKPLEFQTTSPSHWEHLYDEKSLGAQHPMSYATLPPQTTESQVSCLPSGAILSTSATVAWASLSNFCANAEDVLPAVGEAVYYIEQNVVAYFCVGEDGPQNYDATQMRDAVQAIVDKCGRNGPGEVTIVSESGWNVMYGIDSVAAGGSRGFCNTRVSGKL